MPVVTLSSRFQIRLPKAPRDALGIGPGDELEILVEEGHLVLVPVREARELRGFLRGIDTTVTRDADRV